MKKIPLLALAAMAAQIDALTPAVAPPHKEPTQDDLRLIALARAKRERKALRRLLESAKSRDGEFFHDPGWSDPLQAEKAP